MTREQDSAKEKTNWCFLNSLCTHKSVQFLFMWCMLQYFPLISWLRFNLGEFSHFHFSAVSFTSCFPLTAIVISMIFHTVTLIAICWGNPQTQNCPLNNMIPLLLIYFIVCCKCLQCYTLGDLWQTNNSFLHRKDVWSRTVLQRAQSFLRITLQLYLVWI